MSLHIHNCGAATFLDAVDIEKGDDFEDRIVEAAQSCNELVVLLTPSALASLYVFMEIGMFLVQTKRVVTVLYGIAAKDLQGDSRAPLAMKRLQSVDINGIERYFSELKTRIQTSEARDG